MVYRDKVTKCSISVAGLDYDYDDYINKRNITDINNEWIDGKGTFKQQIFFKLDNDSLRVPKTLLFGKNISDYELIKYLAIIEYESPKVIYSYYEINEKYGISNSTIVTKEEKIIKTFFIEYKKEKMPLLLYIKKIEQEIKNSKPDDFIYIPNINYLVERYFDSRIEYSNNDVSTENQDYFNDTYYNDGLDLDQQSEDFWNSL